MEKHEFEPYVRREWMEKRIPKSMEENVIIPIYKGSETVFDNRRAIFLPLVIYKHIQFKTEITSRVENYIILRMS